jgi:hypothetical protein
MSIPVLPVDILANAYVGPEVRAGYDKIRYRQQNQMVITSQSCVALRQVLVSCGTGDHWFVSSPLYQAFSVGPVFSPAPAWLASITAGCACLDHERLFVLLFAARCGATTILPVAIRSARPTCSPRLMAAASLASSPRVHGKQEADSDRRPMFKRALLSISVWRCRRRCACLARLSVQVPIVVAKPRPHADLKLSPGNLHATLAKQSRFAAHFARGSSRGKLDV